MSDNNTLENLMTENTNIEDTNTLAEETVTEEVTTEEMETQTEVEEMPVKEEVSTEEATTEEMETQTTVEEQVEEVVEEMPAVVKEETTEDVVATEEVETDEPTVEETVMEETVETEEVETETIEETPTLVEGQVAMERVLEETATEKSAIEPTKEAVENEEPVEETFAPVEGQVTIEDVATEEALKKQPFKLTPPENNEELFEKMCVKRGRKLIYAPKEVIYDASFTVLGTNKKNEEGIRIKDILEAEIKVGTWLGYLDKYDGLKTSEIKEEYENDIIYEYAEQEFKKMGIIYDGKKLKVYVYDWDGKACHHVGYIDETAAADSIKYFSDKENYSFDLCGIITGGKGKRVTKNENGKITITKEKGGDYGIELDISVIARKD